MGGRGRWAGQRLDGPTAPGASATAGWTPRNPIRSRQPSISVGGTRSSGRGHSVRCGASFGSASAAHWSIMRGRCFSPKRRSLSRPKRHSPSQPTRSGMPARKGASAAFQVRGMISAVP